MPKTYTITLSRTEWGALSEAVRLSQQEYEENSDKLDPVLSRIQRKMGEEPHS